MPDTVSGICAKIILGLCRSDGPNIVIYVVFKKMCEGILIKSSNVCDASTTPHRAVTVPPVCVFGGPYDVLISGYTGLACHVMSRQTTLMDVRDTGRGPL